MRTETFLGNKNQTGKEMYRLIDTYADDIDKFYMRTSTGQSVPFSKLPLDDAFDYVRKLPYKKDHAPVEVVMRPRKILERPQNGYDCKKKSILLGAYLKKNGLNFRLMTSSNRYDKKIHHVFPQVQLQGKWLNVDATYPEYKLFDKKTVTASEELKRI